MKKILLLVISTLLITSCSTHPLGISDETWQNMTPEQQADAYQKQADIDAKQHAQELAYQHQQQQEIANIKAHPEYGQYIQCVIRKGQYQAFINNWNDIQAFSFDAIKGKTTTANLTYYQNNNKFFNENQQLYISFTGTQIKICKDQNAFSDDCSVITATMPQYAKGARVKITSGIIKGTARCDMVYDNNRSQGGSPNIIINV
ncbi:hypothetical protein [Francisella sp. LA112445]|jgi:hypothetical protein|uniref:hypothetical protein n=1 Tax=Francisella sp. LA112445 TaxID=1395624 RepID=UPI001788CEFD|nr:hypothetical protein [Francisella sp. LA112445]QIW09191.1 hypothetical protein FIP56_00240 [Francisella sp. LA112445]